MGNITRKLFGGETEYENTFAKEVTSSCQRARERESGDESESDRPWKQKRLDCNISTSLIQRVVNSGSISRGKRVVKVDRLTTDIVVVTLEDRFPKTLVLKHEVSFPVHDQHHLSDDVASYFMAALTYTFFLREVYTIVLCI
jgi:hypothetical protein